VRSPSKPLKLLSKAVSLVIEVTGWILARTPSGPRGFEMTRRAPIPLSVSSSPWSKNSIQPPLRPSSRRQRDLGRALTFRDWNDRSCKLANALGGLGLEKGDRIAILAYNCLEWMEIYAAVAKAGLVMVPINFRLVGPEVQYIIENSVDGDERRPDVSDPDRARSRSHAQGRTPRIMTAARCLAAAVAGYSRLIAADEARPAARGDVDSIAMPAAHQVIGRPCTGSRLRGDWPPRREKPLCRKSRASGPIPNRAHRP